MKLPRFARLLPSVVIVGTGLLVLNASGLIHDAYAGATQADAMAPPPSAANKDFAAEDGQVASTSEVEVLTSLSKRRSELDTRESQLQVQANVLAATEARVDAKITQLKVLQSQINALLGQRDQAQEKQLASLVKTYSAMKPKDAARIFDSLDNDVLVPVAQQMKSDVLAPVLAAMSPEQAQKLTVKLANKLTLPDTASAPAPVPAAILTPPTAAPTPLPPPASPAAKPAQATKAAATPAPAAKTGG